jgi:hypothetical protein
MPNPTYKEYLDLLRRVMWSIDIPCLVPYFAVILFAYQHSGNNEFQWETYLSGAGSLLLMVSNILTLSQHAIKNKYEFI